MNLNYSQISGLVTEDDGSHVALGWAGRGEGKNNPNMQDVVCTGPLPQGVYTVGDWQDHPRLGPMVAPLLQVQGETFGRSAFFIHGPSSKHYGEESMGCIVVPRAGRNHVKELAPSTITVTA